MSDFDGLMVRARKAIQSERLHRAQALLEEAVLIAPHDRDVHSLLGVVHAKLGKPDRAATAFRRALEIDPDHPTTLQNFAGLLEQQHCIDEATALIEHALTIAPHDEATRRVHKRLLAKADGTYVDPIGGDEEDILGYCPICETPIPADTTRLKCGVCGVSWVPLTSGMVRIEQTLRADEDQLVCASCGSVIEDYRAMHCLRCGRDFLTGSLTTQSLCEAASNSDAAWAGGSEVGRRASRESSGKRTSASVASLALPVPPQAVALFVCLAIVGGLWWHYKSRADVEATAASRAAEQGKLLYDAGRYAEARKAFEEAQTHGAEDAAEKIQSCDQRIVEAQAAHRAAQQQAAAEATAAHEQAQRFLAASGAAQGHPRSGQTRVVRAPMGIAPGYLDRDFYIGIALQAVSVRLKAPRTACFTGGGLPPIGLSIHPDRQVVVSGLVDAQNGFGAMLRTSYLVSMLPDGRVTLVWVGGG